MNKLEAKQLLLKAE
jgi:hypothetical protein